MSPESGSRGKPHSEFGALADFARDSDFTPMGFDNSFDQTEAKAKSALGTALAAPIKAGPNLVLLLRRDADAIVAEFCHGVAWLGADRNADTTGRGRVLDRIVEQVSKYLANAGAINGGHYKRSLNVRS